MHTKKWTTNHIWLMTKCFLLRWTFQLEKLKTKLFASLACFSTKFASQPDCVNRIWWRHCETIFMNQILIRIWTYLKTSKQCVRVIFLVCRALHFEMDEVIRILNYLSQHIFASIYFALKLLSIHITVIAECFPIHIYIYQSLWPLLTVLGVCECERAAQALQKKRQKYTENEEIHYLPHTFIFTLQSFTWSMYIWIKMQHMHCFTLHTECVCVSVHFTFGPHKDVDCQCGFGCLLLLRWFAVNGSFQ